MERNPELVTTALNILAMNPNGHKIKVILCDAFEYLPPEPVDVVICEMIHVAMLREKQIPVISSFKERYLERFGGPLPIFVPEALIQAVQPIQESFDFEGYYAPTIQFQDPSSVQPRTIELAEPAVYQLFSYQDPLPKTCAWNGPLAIERAGTLNAIRFVTKNVLAIVPEEQRTIDWVSQYLIVPLAKPLDVQPETQVTISFSYEAGGSFDELTSSLSVACL